MPYREVETFSFASQRLDFAQTFFKRVFRDEDDPQPHE